MASIVKVKTGNPLELKDNYSRLVVVENWIFVSNTAGRNPQTKEIPDTVEEQTHQIFSNVKKALEAVGSGLEDIVRSRVTVPNPAHVPTVMGIQGTYFVGVDPANTVTSSPLASTKYLVEYEFTAYKGASKLDQERLDIEL